MTFVNFVPVLCLLYLIFTGHKVEDGQPELGLVGGGGPGRSGLAPLRLAGRLYPLRPLQASFSLENIAKFLVSAPCWPPLSSTPSAGKFQLRKDCQILSLCALLHGHHYPLRPLQESFSLEKIAKFLVSAPCWPPLSSTLSAGKFQLGKD
jgi:hypothetical protein